MKIWASRAVAATFTALALAACSASSTSSTGTGSTGAGGSAAATTGAGGGDPCVTGADCASCTDRVSCFTCNSTAHQPGVTPYNALITCLFCTACYTTCDGATTLGQSGGCTAAPTMTDSCDTGTPGMTACDTCQTCSTKSGATCAADLTACEGNGDCKALLTDLATCPAM